MPTLSISVRGTAEPSVVWERYADPRRWPEWAWQIRRVDTTGNRIVAGLRGRVLGPLGAAVNFVVDDVDEAGRTWSWTVRFGPVRLELRHDVVPDGAGSRTRLWVTGPLAVVVPYLPVAAWALRSLVRA